MDKIKEEVYQEINIESMNKLYEGFGKCFDFNKKIAIYFFLL